jgi:carbonic anhydrase/acetyltransferase-like protein (isoleucine patch superfamily)
VKAGAVIPDGSLVIGSPGKVVRENDEQTKQFLLGSAAHYVEKGKKMNSDLVKVQR